LALDPQSRIRFNLEGAAVLLVDETPMGMSILVSVVTGLGAKLLYRCSNVEAAQEAVAQHHIDLAIIDGLAPSGAGYDLVKWIRQNAREPNCFAPILLTTGHTPANDIVRARDCGGNIIIRKPIAPIVLLERIIWASKEGRPYLFSETYVGPDRRFQDKPPPGGLGRRRGDAAADAEAAPQPAAGDEALDADSDQKAGQAS
jgi:DNA-binding response OmpR family regulator